MRFLRRPGYSSVLCDNNHVEMLRKNIPSGEAIPADSSPDMSRVDKELCWCVISSLCGTVVTLISD